jgi:hypothetical protein
MMYLRAASRKSERLKIAGRQARGVRCLCGRQRQFDDAGDAKACLEAHALGRFVPSSPKPHAGSEKAMLAEAFSKVKPDQDGS